MADVHSPMGLCGILFLNTVLFLGLRSTCSMSSYPPPSAPIRIAGTVLPHPPPLRIPAANSPLPTPMARRALLISKPLGPRIDSQPEDETTEYLGSNAVEFNVLNYEAVGDSTTNDTQAFQDAWTAACAVEAGYVHAPAGYSFMVYPIIFTGPCATNMTFKVDGTLLAPKDPGVWADYSKYWVQFKNVSMTLQGLGTIDGQGQTWWADSCKTVKTNPCVDGPTAIVFNTSTNVTVKNVVIRNSQQMHLAFEKSSEILVNNVTISSPGTSPNTDGIHLQNSSHVTIKNTVIGTGDDCISIQTGSFYVNIKNVQCGPGHGISVGGLGESKSRAELSGLVVDSVVFNNATNGLRIKTWQGSYGYANNFSFTNIKMVNTKNPILIDQYYCDSGSSGSCTNYTSNVVVSDIKYADITGTSGTMSAVTFRCSQTVACTGISLYHINLLQTTGTAATASCLNAYGTASRMVIPASCLAT